MTIPKNPLFTLKLRKKVFRIRLGYACDDYFDIDGPSQTKGDVHREQVSHCGVLV